MLFVNTTVLHYLSLDFLPRCYHDQIVRGPDIQQFEKRVVPAGHDDRDAILQVGSDHFVEETRLHLVGY